jgi:hypothetical protein
MVTCKCPAWVSSWRGGGAKLLSCGARNLAPRARLYGVAQKLSIFLEYCNMYESPGPIICVQ